MSSGRRRRATLRGVQTPTGTADIPGSIAGQRFVHTLRARFAETDAMGVVHHGAYPLYLESARVEYLRSLGQPYGVIRAAGIDFAVVELVVGYRRPIRFDDLVSVAVTVSSVTRATFDMAYELSVEGSSCATARTRHAAVGPDGRPRRLPAWVVDMARAAPGLLPGAPVPGTATAGPAGNRRAPRSPAELGDPAPPGAWR